MLDYEEFAQLYNSKERTYFPLVKELGDFYEEGAEPSSRQLYFLEQLAQTGPDELNLLMGPALLGLGGLYRETPFNILNTFRQVHEALNIIVANPGQLMVRGFSIPYPSDLEEDKVIEVDFKTLPNKYKERRFNLNIGFYALRALTEEEIIARVNQIERGAKAVGINNQLPFHIFDVYSGRIVSFQGFNDLPEITGQALSIRLEYNPNLFDHPHLKAVVNLDGSTHPSYLFDGVVMIDSRTAISQSQVIERMRIEATAKEIKRREDEIHTFLARLQASAILRAQAEAAKLNQPGILASLFSNWPGRLRRTISREFREPTQLTFNQGETQTTKKTKKKKKKS